LPPWESAVRAIHASLEVDVEPLHDIGERRSGTANRDRLRTCACPVISIRANSITSLLILQVKVYLRQSLTLDGREAI
jgi:hypothetical protein